MSYRNILLILKGIQDDPQELSRLRRHLEEHLVNDQPSSETAHAERKFMVNNYRPVQPLNGRTVYRSFRSLKTPDEKAAEQDSKSSKPTGNLCSYLSQYLTVTTVPILKTKQINHNCSQTDFPFHQFIIKCIWLIDVFVF